MINTLIITPVISKNKTRAIFNCACKLRLRLDWLRPFYVLQRMVNVQLQLLQELVVRMYASGGSLRSEQF